MDVSFSSSLESSNINKSSSSSSSSDEYLSNNTEQNNHILKQVNCPPASSSGCLSESASSSSSLPEGIITPDSASPTTASMDHQQQQQQDFQEFATSGDETLSSSDADARVSLALNTATAATTETAATTATSAASMTALDTTGTTSATTASPPSTAAAEPGSEEPPSSSLQEEPQQQQHSSSTTTNSSTTTTSAPPHLDTPPHPPLAPPPPPPATTPPPPATTATLFEPIETSEPSAEEVEEEGKTIHATTATTKTTTATTTLPPQDYNGYDHLDAGGGNGDDYDYNDNDNDMASQPAAKGEGQQQQQEEQGEGEVVLDKNSEDTALVVVDHHQTHTTDASTADADAAQAGSEALLLPSLQEEPLQQQQHSSSTTTITASSTSEPPHVDTPHPSLSPPPVAATTTTAVFEVVDLSEPAGEAVEGEEEGKAINAATVTTTTTPQDYDDSEAGGGTGYYDDYDYDDDDDDIMPSQPPSKGEEQEEVPDKNSEAMALVVDHQTHATGVSTAAGGAGAGAAAGGGASSAAIAEPPEVIELLDDDDDDEVDDVPLPATDHQQQHKQHYSESSKRQKLSDGSSAIVVVPSTTNNNSNNHRPLTAPLSLTAATSPRFDGPHHSAHRPSLPVSSSPLFDRPEYLSLPANFLPTWNEMLPPPALAPPRAPPPFMLHAASTNKPRQKYFKLSLLNVSEFTITGLPISYDSPPTSIAGLRVPIRKISREHGKAVFQREADKDEELGEDRTNSNDTSSNSGGKWRIPLGAYHPFYSWLTTDPYCRVDGIPPHQLQIASLERARQEKGYPSEEALVEKGVPRMVAKALAPFQRGGVDFVLEKGGRALVADDMGLGKTIQGIASMAAYMNEWPLIVLCPSSARYHWETEFQRWLGVESESGSANVGEVGESEGEEVSNNKNNNSNAETVVEPLESWQINVLSSSKDQILPYADTKVVICSYGLAPALVQMGKISANVFGAVIVDESHMLKNKGSKRTKLLVPILRSIGRCVLLSGTPAMARPAELWPQLDILRAAQQHDWWENEADFMNKYVKRGGPILKAELHTMLTGTIMIRRLKNDILKSLPRKLRSKAVLHVLSPDQVTEFKGLLAQLRQSKGALGKIARSHHASTGTSEEEKETVPDAMLFAKDLSSNARVDAEMALRTEMNHRSQEGRFRIHQSLAATALESDIEHRNDVLLRMQGDLQAHLDRECTERSSALDAQFGTLPGSVPPGGEDSEEAKRTTLLSRMYSLTGDVKIPVVVDMLRRWLRDPTKGKLCIFAHHLSVLNAIRDQAGLSNDQGSNHRYIRIDGATLPKQRQEQIKAFQTDPSVRVALLGITAAGVAVTLVASSTVWFAELFWTPAIMVQAEDRCHRIGQQARVNCLYFVARGTLDEILWKLIEKKFQDLGEFVEGKEKLKMVVEKVYESEKELHSMFEILDDMEVDGDWFDDDTGVDKDLTFDDFADDIAKLGQEECDMLRIDSDEDEEGDGIASSAVSDDRKVSAIEIPATGDGMGRTEDEAIVLDDDDEEEEKAPRKVSPQVVEHAASKNGAGAANVPREMLSLTLRDCRLYNIRIATQRLGLELSLYKGRAVVTGVTQERLERLGVNAKPAAGDILVALNGTILPPASKISNIVELIRSALLHPPMELTCAEYPIFQQEFQKARQMVSRRQAERSKSSAENVIDLIDDDDDD